MSPRRIWYYNSEDWDVLRLFSTNSVHKNTDSNHKLCFSKVYYVSTCPSSVVLIRILSNILFLKISYFVEARNRHVNLPKPDSVAALHPTNMPHQFISRFPYTMNSLSSKFVKLVEYWSQQVSDFDDVSVGILLRVIFYYSEVSSKIVLMHLLPS